MPDTHLKPSNPDGISSSRQRRNPNVSALRRGNHPKKDNELDLSHEIKPENEDHTAIVDAKVPDIALRHRHSSSESAEERGHCTAALVSTHDHTPQLRALMSQLPELQKAQDIHDGNAQRLREGIRQKEESMGRMLRQLLELQEAVSTRGRHIQEDREKLAQEEAASVTKRVQIHDIIARIGRYTS